MDDSKENIRNENVYQSRNSGTRAIKRYLLNLTVFCNQNYCFDTIIFILAFAGPVYEKWKCCLRVEAYSNKKFLITDILRKMMLLWRPADQEEPQTNEVGFISLYSDLTFYKQTLYTVSILFIFIFLALNATVAVRRVRSKQNESLKTNEGASAPVSQVLNPELSFNRSGKNPEMNNLIRDYLHMKRSLCVLGRSSGRARKCLSLSSELEGSSVTSGGDQSSLGLLQAMLGQVEADLETLVPHAEPESSQGPKHHRTQGLTGFSVALVSTLGRLVHVLKQVLRKSENTFLIH